MLNAFLFRSMNEQTRVLLYIVIETPDSGAFEFLDISLKDSSEETFFYIPTSKNTKKGFYTAKNIYLWNDKEIPSFSLEELPRIKLESESFLFFSPLLDFSDQFELLIKQIEKEPAFEIGRVISFINAEELLKGNSKLQSWLDAAAHFSDALCITNRSNENGKDVGKLLQRYEDMRYPMESYLISKSKRGKIANILNPTPRRISHIFDSPELLEAEDTPWKDPYLSELPNGRREKIIPLPFSRN